MNKKGSMELSVNSIVILVIAIVMMGLILTFVKTKFNQLNIAADEPEPFTPSAGEPITLSKGSISIVQGGKIPIKIGIYNDDSSPLTNVVPIFNCTDSLTITATVLEQNIAPKESKVFGAILKAEGVKNQYVCNLCVAYATTPSTCITTAPSKEVFVEVR
jgi:hypothetical protein